MRTVLGWEAKGNSDDKEHTMEYITTDTAFRVTDGSDGSIREARGTIELEDLLKEMFDGDGEIVISEDDDGVPCTVGDCIREIIDRENRGEDASGAECALDITVERI